jgi:hypothetical protein
MKTIVLQVAMNIPCTENLAQSARNYPGAVVDVDDNFADQAIELGEATLYIPPADDFAATNTLEAATVEPPKPSQFNDSRFGAEDA